MLSVYEHDGLQILALSCIIIPLEASLTHAHTRSRVWVFVFWWKIDVIRKNQCSRVYMEIKSAKSRMKQILFPAQMEHNNHIIVRHTPM